MARGPVARARRASRAVAVPTGVSWYRWSGRSLPGASTPSARQRLAVRAVTQAMSCSPGGWPVRLSRKSSSGGCLRHGRGDLRGGQRIAVGEQGEKQLPGEHGEGISAGQRGGGGAPQVVRVAEHATALGGQRQDPPGAARDPEFPGEAPQLVQGRTARSRCSGGRERSQPNRAAFLLNERPAEVAALGQGDPACQWPSSHRHRQRSAAACAGSSTGCSSRLATTAAICCRVGLRQRLTQASARSDVITAASDWPSSSSRGVSRWARTRFCSGLPAPRPGAQVAAGNGQLQQLGGRGRTPPPLGAHSRAPGEPWQVGRGDAGRGGRAAEGGLPVPGADLVGGQDAACGRRPADGGIPRHLQQVERASQGGDYPFTGGPGQSSTSPGAHTSRSSGLGAGSPAPARGPWRSTPTPPAHRQPAAGSSTASSASAAPISWSSSSAIALSLRACAASRSHDDAGGARDPGPSSSTAHMAQLPGRPRAPSGTADRPSAVLLLSRHATSPLTVPHDENELKHGPSASPAGWSASSQRLVVLPPASMRAVRGLTSGAELAGCIRALCRCGSRCRPGPGAGGKKVA